MLNPNELRADKAQLIASAEQIRDGAKAGERDLTEEENSKIDERLDQAEKLEARAQEIEAVERREARLAAAAEGLVVDDGAHAGGLELSPDADIRGGRDRQIDVDPECGFENYGDFAHVVKVASRPGGRVDERLLKMEAAYGQHGASGEDGGFLNPPGYSTRIYERAMESLPVLDQTDKIVLTGPGNSITINGMVDHAKQNTTYRYGGVVVYRVDEADQITRSNLKFRQITLKLTKQAALSFCTEEELSDAFVNFGERLLSKHAAAIADELVEDVMFGNGAGRPLGAFASDACISITKETEQADDTIVTENIFGMEQALWPNSEAGANFYYNHECHKQLRTLVLAVGAGGQTVNLFDNRGRPASLDGYSAYKTEHCEALGDAGDICLGDFRQYLFATKGTLRTAMSIHLRFDYDEVAFKSTFRNDGRPAWEQSLRPRKGASTFRVSPFVKIAARG